MYGFNNCNVGFDQFSWNWVMNNLPGYCKVEHVSLDLVRLANCGWLFMGNNGGCGDAVRFSQANWGDIEDWVRAGGRLWISAEHSGDYDTVRGGIQNGMEFRCLNDIDRLNSFLTEIGSSIIYEGNDYNSESPTCTEDYYGPGDAGIMAGLGMVGERFGKIGGGVSLLIGKQGDGGTGGSGPGHHGGLDKIAGAIERLGLGIVAVVGDGNQSACGSNNGDPTHEPAKFLKRWTEWETADIV